MMVWRRMERTLLPSSLWSYNHVFEHKNEHFHLPSIVYPHTSYPLIAMSHSCTKHCLTPLTFLLSIRYKLLLPIYPNRTPCTCGHHVHDIYGYHTFCCKQGSKKRAHIIIAMDFAGSLSPVFAQAGYLFPNTPMAVEQFFHLRSDSKAQPFGISFSPNSRSHSMPLLPIHHYHRAPAYPQHLPT